jgi:spore maturation protein SpmB
VWRAVVAALFMAAFAFLLVRYVVRVDAAGGVSGVLREIFSFWSLPAIVAALVLFGWARGVKVYDEIVEGGKEGFQVALRIIAYLVAILVAVGMLRASGGIDLLVMGLSHLTTPIGMPAEALPMALLRPLSGSGAYGVMAEIMTTHGPDSFIGYMVSTFQGSTETTFYVLAVYFGAVGVKETRHTLPACLLADTAGILAAVFIVNLMFG